MEITELRAYPVREPVSGRVFTILRVQTRTGITGFGECGQVSTEDLSAARQFWTGRLASTYAHSQPGSPLAGAIDMALLDIVGKSAKAPVYRILGGPTRNKARAFTTIGGVSFDEKVSGVAKAVSVGFRAFGVGLPARAARNQGQAYQNEVRRLVKAVREHGGDFVAGAGADLTPGDAARVAVELEAVHPLWFDEPCSLTNQQTLRKIADESTVPLGFGRGVRGAGEFQDLLREGWIDIVRPELSHFGITGTRRIAAMAETYYVAVAPHHDGGPIGTAAALQLAASLPNFFIQHIPMPPAPEDREMRAAIAGRDIEGVKDGFAALPTGPGLGITVNESALEKYRAA